MLVCNISAPPRRAALAVAIAEAAAAADVLATGFSTFTALIDDPASVRDFTDAFTGDILVEAASASDTVTVAGGAISATVNEAATAVSAEDATVAGAVVATSAMIAGPYPVFVNPGTSREANVIGIQVNQ